MSLNEILGGVISPDGISSQAWKNQKFSRQTEIPQIRKGNTVLPGIPELLQKKYIPRMAGKLHPFYNLLKTNGPINITSEMKEITDSVKEALSDVCNLALKQPIPRKQLVLMTDATFRKASYALMIENNPDQIIQSKRKKHAPVASGSKVFSPAHIIYSRKILTIYIALLEFAYCFWKITRPTIVLTDNKSVAPLFQTKAIPPALCNAYDCVLQSTSKDHTSLFQSTLEVNFSPD